MSAAPLRAFRFLDGRAEPVAWTGELHREVLGEPTPDVIEVVDDAVQIVSTKRTERTWIRVVVVALKWRIAAGLYLPPGVTFGPAHAAALNIALGLMRPPTQARALPGAGP